MRKWKCFAIFINIEKINEYVWKNIYDADTMQINCKEKLDGHENARFKTTITYFLSQGNKRRCHLTIYFVQWILVLLKKTLILDNWTRNSPKCRIAACMVNIWNKKGLTAPKRKLFQIVSLNVKYRICVWDSYSAELYVDYILWFNFLESYIIDILHS